MEVSRNQKNGMLLLGKIAGKLEIGVWLRMR